MSSHILTPRASSPVSPVDDPAAKRSRLRLYFKKKRNLIAALIALALLVPIVISAVHHVKVWRLKYLYDNCVPNVLSIEAADELLPPSMEKKYPVSEDSFTIVINSYKRHTELYNALRHYLACGGTTAIDQIRVAWSEPVTDIPGWLSSMELKGRVVLDLNEYSNLTNRFKPRNFTTSAIFSQDDDIYYTCEIVQAAFEFWRRHADSMTGFSPRYWEKEDPGIEVTQQGRAWDTGVSSVVLVTKGGFMHRTWYERFFAEEMRDLRDYVDKHVTGEDFLMGMLHAKVSKRPPIPMVIQRKHMTYFPNAVLCQSKTGLTRTNKDKAHRAVTLAYINKGMGDPLLKTSIFVDPLLSRGLPDTSCATSKSKDNIHRTCKHSGNVQQYPHNF